MKLFSIGIIFATLFAVMKKYNAIQATKAARRNKAMEEGMYDGRFRSKVIVDKRKESSKKKCRKLVLIPNAD